MIIQDVDVYPLRLPMKQSFAISGGKVGDPSSGAPHVYVKLTDEAGHIGWGECRPSHRWSYETLESVVSTLRHYIKPLLLGQPAEDVQGLTAQMNRHIAGGQSAGQPIAKAAVDMALHDLIARRRQVPLAGLWLSSGQGAVNLSYLISTASPDEAAAHAMTAKEQGYLGVDVKIGLNPAKDIEILEAVKQHAPGLFFRVDANQAYDLPAAVRTGKALERIGVDVFEQPLAAGNWLGHAELRRKIGVPIALDESVWSPGDTLQAIRLEACDTIVVKVTKMGGLSGAKLCGEIAKASGLGLLGGGLTESRLGLSASAQLFNHLQIRTPVDLNGPFFLADDPVESFPDLQDGAIRLSGRPGTGCDVSMHKIDRYTYA